MRNYEHPVDTHIHTHTQKKRVGGPGNFYDNENQLFSKQKNKRKVVKT